MTSLQYYCILGLAEIKTLHPRDKLCAKDTGCAGNKITAHVRKCVMAATPMPTLNKFRSLHNRI